MKRSYILLLVFIVSACALTNALNNPERYKSCLVITQKLQKGSEWTNQCTADQNSYYQGLYGIAEISTPEELCTATQTAIVESELNIIQSVINKKKVNCSPYHAAVVKNLSMPELCTLWSTGSRIQEITEVARKEVKSRQVDCPAVLSSMAQQRQALTTERMYQQQIYMQSQPQQQAPAPQGTVKTNCTQQGNNISCESKPDVCIVCGLKTFDDYRR